jgi:hypothetical protein
MQALQATQKRLPKCGSQILCVDEIASVTMRDIRSLALDPVICAAEGWSATWLRRSNSKFAGAAVSIRTSCVNHSGRHVRQIRSFRVGRFASVWAASTCACRRFAIFFHHDLYSCCQTGRKRFHAPQKPRKTAIGARCREIQVVSTNLRSLPDGVAHSLSTDAD